MLKGHAKDKIRNGIILLAVAMLALFLARGIFFNYLLGPHPMSLSDVMSPGSDEAEDGDYVIVSGRAARLPVSEVVTGANVSTDKQVDIDYTQADYYMLIGPESEIFMKSDGRQKLAADSTEGVYGKFPGILRTLDETSEEGHALMAAFEGPDSQRPRLMLDNKADVTMPVFFSWLLLALIGALVLRALYLIVRGWLRLRQP